MKRILRKALLVFRKELLMMRRDRRLTVGVGVTSLIVMPALMGFLGSIAQSSSRDDQIVPVLLLTNHPAAAAALGRARGIALQRGQGTNVGGNGYVTVLGTDATITIISDRTKPRLWETARQIEMLLAAEKDSTIARQLEAQGISASILDPFTVSLQDASNTQSRGALLFGTLVPYLVIVLLVANSIRATYVAVGEKEHNTLASLLVSRVPRQSIVLGKSLAITTFAIFASVLLIIGMVLFASLGFSIAADSLGKISFELSAVQTGQLLINIGGLALLISSVIMVLGTYARTQREAGVYTAPLLFVSIFLAVFSFSDRPFSLATFAIPVLGNALAMKYTIVGGVEWLQLALTLTVNAFVFVALLWASVTMYRRETVLFRGGKRK